MVDPALQAYVTQQVEHGVPRETIMALFEAAGWPQAEVLAALKVAARVRTKTTTGMLSVTKLLTCSWDSYRKHWKSYALIIISGLIGTWAAFYFNFQLFNLVASPLRLVPAQTREAILALSTGQRSVLTAAVFFLLMCLLIPATLVPVWSFAALVGAVVTGQTSFVLAYKQSLANLVPTWRTALIALLAVLGGIYLFFIPGVLFIFWFIFWPFVIVEQKAYGMRSLYASYILVKGSFFGLLARLLVLVALGIAIIFVPVVLASPIHAEFVASYISTGMLLLLLPFGLQYLLHLKHNLEATKQVTIQKVPVGFAVVVWTAVIWAVIVFAAFFFVTTYLRNPLPQAKLEAFLVQRNHIVITDYHKGQAVIARYYATYRVYPKDLRVFGKTVHPNLLYDPATNTYYRYIPPYGSATYRLCEITDVPSNFCRSF